MAMKLTCPRCQTLLVPRRVNVEGRSVIVDVCANGCGGVWLDDTDTRSGLDASDDLLDVVPDVPAASEADRGRPVLCPACQGPTQRFRWNYQSPVWLDNCAAGHGTWIDGGEVFVMEKWETDQALAEPEKASVLARVHMARLEAETAMIPDENDRLGNPIVNALQNVYRKLL